MGGIVDMVFGKDEKPGQQNIVGASEVSAESQTKGAEIQAKAITDAAAIQAKSYIDAANISAAAKREALDYIKETEKLPQQFRLEALAKLGGLIGLEGGEGDQQALIDRAITSPLYKSIMGGKEAGEESILRNAGMTGGFRSGDTQENLYDYNTQLQNMALLASYNEQLSGLQGMAGIPSNITQIADLIAGIGSTKASGVFGAGSATAQGTVGAGNAYAQGVVGSGTALSQGMTAANQYGQDVSQNNANNLLGLGNLGLTAAYMFSDRRLKKNVEKIGEVKGFNFYSFAWNSIANKLGLFGKTCGCMAEEVFDINPEAVSFKDNFLLVNYSMIGVL